jgi:proteic killer suppression protein
MIKSFRDKETELVFARKFSRRLPEGIQRIAQRKLRMLYRAVALNDLRMTASNCLEKLKGDRKDQYSIRINKQWRICFLWIENNVYQAEIIDYH